MVLTKYGFENCVGAFFEMSTADARALLPAHLEPLEKQHTRSVLAILAFQFTESEVGSYDELVLAVITPPRVEAGKPLPKAAFFPFMVATSTAESRAHAIERWHLPHWMEDVGIEFEEKGGSRRARVTAGSDPVAELTVTEHSWTPVSHLYQSFMREEDHAWLANITMEGSQSEHEEETGRVKLYEHAFNKDLDVSEVYEVPFREIWMRDGVQTFEPLVELQTA